MANPLQLTPLEVRGMWLKAANNLKDKEKATGIKEMLGKLGEWFPSTTGKLSERICAARAISIQKIELFFKGA